MGKWKKCIGAVTAASLFLTALPVEGVEATVYASGESSDAAEPDVLVRLQPSEASTFHDTNGDGLGEFEGWGTSLCWWANRLGYSEKLINQAADVFFSDKGLDLNIGRYNVGGGDDAGEVSEVPVNKDAAFYDLETEGFKPTYEGSSMKVGEVSGLADAVYTDSDADFGITKGKTVGTVKAIGWINKLGDAPGSGGNLNYTVTAAEEGSYTVKLMLTLGGTNNRDIAIKVNGDANAVYSADSDTINNGLIASGNNQKLFIVTLKDVKLNKGENSVVIGGNSGWTLDFMKMAVMKSGEEGELPETDEFLHPSHIKRSDSEVPGYCTDITKIKLTEKHTIDWYNKNFTRVDEECGYAWNYDWDADKNQMNILLAAAKASGTEFISEAFSNSPPYFMTNSGCSTGALDASKDNLRSDSYHAFASYMADVIEHINKEENGITFQSTTPMNEPYTNYWGAYSNKQEGCHFDQGDSQSNIIEALNTELKKKGIDIIISGTDETSIDTAISSYKALSTEAKDAITRIDTHTYSGSKRSELSTLAETSGENLWMSEVDGSFTAGTDAGEMSAALGFGQRVITDVRGLKSSAWILWNAVDMNVDANNQWDADSLEALNYNSEKGYWGIAIGDHNNENIILTKKYYAYGQFTKYIRPGYTIIGTSGNALAAYDSENHKVVIVALNTAGEDKSCKFSLKSFKTMGTNISAIRTSGSVEDGENWADVSATDDIIADTENKNFTATLKANSITTYTIEGVTYDASEDEMDTMKEIPLDGSMVTGSAPWNNTSNDATKAVDGDLSTFFDGVSNGYLVIDLGNTEKLAALAFAPRSGFDGRCVNASFYGSNDGETWTKLYTVDSAPVSDSYTYVYSDQFKGGENSYRYIKYAVPEGDTTANCNIAEIKVFAEEKTLSEQLAYYKEKMKGHNYSESSRKTFEDAAKEAQALIDSNSTDQTAISNALTALETAFNGLKEIKEFSSFSGVDGAKMYDTKGDIIQAHGGQIQQLTVNGETKWYWIGEDKTNDYRPCAGIHMYTSTDLYNWTDEGLVLKTMTNEDQFTSDEYFKSLYGDLTEEKQKEIYVDLWQGDSDAGCVMERPKMLYNEKTGKYVIWFHADGNDPYSTDSSSNYAKAKAGVAISDSPTGPFTLLGSYLLDTTADADHGFDSIGGHVRDMNVFKDDDGTAYVMYSSDGNQTMYIAKLNADYTGLAVAPESAVEGVDYTRNFIGASREAPAMFKYNGKYYMISSACTGWSPNQAQYAVADQPLGPWTTMGNPCTDSGASTTYDTQSTCVFPVDAANGKFIYMGDRWMNPDNGGSLRDSRYVFLPVEFTTKNQIALRSYSNWTLDDLENKQSYEIQTTLPDIATSVEDLKSKLPSKIKVKFGSKEATEVNVTWSNMPAAENQLGSVTITGTMENGRSFTHPVQLINDKMIYFFDCGAEESAYVNEVKQYLGTKLRNEDADQVYTTTNHAGFSGDTENDIGTKNAGDTIWAHGYWAKGGKDIKYSFDLEAGNYMVATGYQEWWNTSRATNIAVTSENTTLATKDFTLASSDTALQENVSFELKEAATVTVTISKTGNPDPVLSWISMIQEEQTGKLADMTALNETIKKASELKEASYTKESWSGFESAYKSALATQKNIQESQENVDASNTALKNAMTALKTIQTYLKEGIKKNYIQPADASKYTTATWKIYQKYLQEAQKLAEKADVDEIDAEQALKSLSDAKSVLEPKKATVISATTSYQKTYGDKAFSLNAKITSGDGKLTYRSTNTKVATVSGNGIVTIKGTGSCTIEVLVAATDKYTAKAQTITISVAKAKQSITYTGQYNKAYGDKAFKLNAKVKTGEGKLSYASSDKKVATVSKNGKVTIQGTGRCTIQVTASGTGNYKAKSVSITIQVQPKKQSVKKLKVDAGKKLMVSWIKDSNATGYEIQYSLKKNFKSSVSTKTVNKSSSSSITIKKLAKGKQYYVHIRAYKLVKVNGKLMKIYGSWSDVKKSGKIK